MDDVGCAPGPSVAGGLFRNGILPTPVVAEDVALSALGRQGSVDLSPFAPTRASRA
jgi:glycine/D-amino acid oxidase-like deaminating enzyme